MKEIVILSIVIVLVILIITLYEHFIVSNAANPPCTSTQSCCDPPPQLTSITMFSFKFCWITGITFPVFADCAANNRVVGYGYTGPGSGSNGGSGTPGLTQTSLINYPNATAIPSPFFNQPPIEYMCNAIPSYGSGVGMWYLTTDTTTPGSGIIYQHSPFMTPGQTPISFCYAMLIFHHQNNDQNGNPIYTGIVVNYSLDNKSLTYTYENVANGLNTKTIQYNMLATYGESMSSNNYLGCCDLSAWYNSLLPSDQTRIGTYNAAFATPGNQPTIAGQSMLNPTTDLPYVISSGNTNTISLSPTVLRHGSVFGATVTSYNYNTSVPGIPYYPFYF